METSSEADKIRRDKILAVSQSYGAQRGECTDSEGLKIIIILFYYLLSRGHLGIPPVSVRARMCESCLYLLHMLNL